MTTAKLFRLGLALGLLLPAVGCRSRLATVTGRVVSPDGTSCAGGSVVFNPLDLAQNPFAGQGVIKPDGTFRLGTTAPDEGIAPGRYSVAIEPAGDKGINADTKEAEFTVVNGSNDFTITVQKPDSKKSRKKG